MKEFIPLLYEKHYSASGGEFNLKAAVGKESNGISIAYIVSVGANKFAPTNPSTAVFRFNPKKLNWILAFAGITNFKNFPYSISSPFGE